MLKTSPEDHSLLLQCLSLLGFDYVSWPWFQNYLSDRSQCVKIGHIQSSFLPITKGVPQGSVLGPVLFTIYIYNITSSLYNSNFHGPFSCADSIHDATVNLQLSFNLLQKHLYNLKLVLNWAKAKWMLFFRTQEILTMVVFKFVLLKTR